MKKDFENSTRSQSPVSVSNEALILDCQERHQTLGLMKSDFVNVT